MVYFHTITNFRFKDMYINAIKTSDVYKLEFHHDMYGLAEVEYELDTTLQTILSEVMAKDIINNEYTPKKENVNILELLSKIKGDRYKWFLNPNDFPNILIDPTLLFYIIRNALSNANKYGEKMGNIFINIEMNNKKLKISIKNFPGMNHDKLRMISNPNIIFNKGIRLHEEDPINKNSKISSGDGAWIMQTCAKLCNGLCSIIFNSDHTLFTFECDVEIDIKSRDYKHFIFPNDTFIYIIDDSKIQRRMLKRHIESIQNKCIQIETLGNGEEEIINIQFY